MLRRPAALAAAALLALALAACGGAEDTRADQEAEVPIESAVPPKVAAAAYPFVWLVQQVGGSDIALLDLASPGVEPHDVELAPKQAAELSQADLVVRFAGFQPALDDASPGGDADFELSEVTDPRQDGDTADPHVWLDPVRLATAARTLGERLSEVDPDSAAGYRDRARQTAEKLELLDAQLKAQLSTCQRKDLVTTHTAFSYFAARYGLQQLAISGTSPEAEPSPGKVAEVARTAKQRGVTTVFAEPGDAGGVAATVAREIGGRTAVLDPVETVGAGGDYLSVMRRNADVLRDGLGCS